MNPKRAIAVVLAAAAFLAGCGSSGPAEEGEPPAALATVAGSDVLQVTLTEQAVQRIAIQTDTVQEAQIAVGGATPALHKVLPYAAVVYDSDGSTWTYTTTAPRTYLRQPITVESIQGYTAILTAGPPVGTTVVVVGAPELLGAELEISGEE
jgi:ABC-type oligopeptide transport system substrate-binding subunit